MDLKKKVTFRPYLDITIKEETLDFFGYSNGVFAIQNQAALLPLVYFYKRVLFVILAEGGSCSNCCPCTRHKIIKNRKNISRRMLEFHRRVQRRLCTSRARVERSREVIVAAADVAAWLKGSSHPGVSAGLSNGNMLLPRAKSYTEE